VFVVDQYTGFDGVLDAWDGKHPDDSGSAKMASRWAEAVLQQAAPVARADVYASGALSVGPEEGLLANDRSWRGSLWAELVTPPTRGTLVLRTDGSFEYTPDPLEVGDSFGYAVWDGAERSLSATVTLGLPEL
jgi:hypothetical protein